MHFWNPRDSLLRGLTFDSVCLPTPSRLSLRNQRNDDFFKYVSISLISWSRNIHPVRPELNPWRLRSWWLRCQYWWKYWSSTPTIFEGAVPILLLMRFSIYRNVNSAFCALWLARVSDIKHSLRSGLQKRGVAEFFLTNFEALGYLMKLPFECLI